MIACTFECECISATVAYLVGAVVTYDAHSMPDAWGCRARYVEVASGNDIMLPFLIFSYVSIAFAISFRGCYLRLCFGDPCMPASALTLIPSCACTEWSWLVVDWLVRCGRHPI